MGGEKGKLAQTAFILISLLEWNPNSEELKKTIGYLEKHHQNIKDDYTLSIVTYSLTLAQSKIAPALIEKLKSKAIIAGSLLF